MTNFLSSFISGATVTVADDTLTANETTTSTTFVDSGLSVTIPNITGGSYVLSGSLQHSNTASNANEHFQPDIDLGAETANRAAAANVIASCPVIGTGVADGRTLTIVKHTTAGTQNLFGDAAGDRASGIIVLGIG